MNSDSSRSIEPYKNADQLYESATSEFCKLVEQVLSDNPVVRISLSGGSTPKRLYELLATQNLPWDKLHWFWGDERNVASTHAESNARMVREALLEKVRAPEANIHTVPVNVDDPYSAAKEYEQTLKDHFPGQPFPQWDLALLGMGDDAHTASLFPETKAIGEVDRWFVENWVQKLDTFRYTLTAPAINSARQAWFLISGEAKRQAVSQVLGHLRNPSIYPSQLIKSPRWFITRDAAPGS